MSSRNESHDLAEPFSDIVDAAKDKNVADKRHGRQLHIPKEWVVNPIDIKALDPRKIHIIF